MKDKIKHYIVNFRQFLYDVSFCVEKDEDFTQIIKSLGYHY